MSTHAIVRKPGEYFAEGITTTDLGKPDYDLMVRQHQAYIQTLESLDLEVIVLEAEPNIPDAYFVEDIAVVTALVAVITNPGAPERRGEQDTTEPVLVQFRLTIRTKPSSTDGGNVLIG